MAWFARNKQHDVAEEEVVEEPRLPEPPETDEAGMRSVEDHSQYILSLVEPLKPFGMSLLEAWDQVMCEDVNSMIDIPSSSTARVEGYAVRATDLLDGHGHLARPLQLVGRDVDWLPEGAAVAVAAGDVLPRGANAVLPGSFADFTGDRIRLVERVAEGEYVRAAGDHLSVGTRLLTEGDVLDDRGIGLLASAGIDKVLVRPRPRVVVISAGRDLVDPGAQVEQGQSVDGNSYLIAAAARAAGATVFRVAVRSDDPGQLKQVITDQLIRADLVVATTSGGREDYEAVVEAMGDLGLVDTAQVAMSPGQVQNFGLIGEERVPMLVLPGNPVSAYVSFHAFVRPLIRKLMGASVEHRVVRAIASAPIRSRPGVLHLVRGRVSTSGSVRTVDQVSRPHALGELAACNALIVLWEDVEAVRAGESVHVWLLDED